MAFKSRSADHSTAADAAGLVFLNTLAFISMGALMANQTVDKSPVEIQSQDITLLGDLQVPEHPKGLVIFAHGSGSSRLSSRNRYVAGQLNAGGLATLLFDLLTKEEEQIDLRTRHLRFDIPLLNDRLTTTADWVKLHDVLSALPVGLFGASTGAAAALMTAADRPDIVQAVVSRGGRPDLAKPKLPKVRAATLLIVGGDDVPVIGMNEEAADQLQCEHKIEVVPGATHLFEEPGKLDTVSDLATAWFQKHLTPTPT